MTLTEPQISQLSIYPVKSCAGIQISERNVVPTGLEGDRQYMVITDQGKHVNQISTTSTAILALVQPNLIEGGITLSAPGMSTIQVEDKTFFERDVDVYGTSCIGYDQGDLVAEWFSDLLGTNYRFVKQASPRLREKSRRGSNESLEFQVNLADGYSFLIANLASLDDLNTRIKENNGAPVPMDRFRPNVIVSGAEAWAEDNWREIGIGDVGFQVIKGCVRCAITTIDQRKGRSVSKEPLKTLSTFRQAGDIAGVIFGVYAVNINQGIIRIGDKVNTKS